MLRAIAAAKKKNDRIDAGKIADCLRCDVLPECYMTSAEIRDRRRTLRYRNLVLKQMVQMKNRISGLLMETGVSYNKQRLHKLGYFTELRSGNEEVDESIRPLLKLSRETIVRSQGLDYALVSSLERDPLLAERLKRLRTIPGVGPIPALTWALEIGDVSRFQSVKQTISYCGLCSEKIRQAAADNPAVLIRLLSTLGRLAPKMQKLEDRTALLEQAAAARDTANTRTRVNMDREDIEAAWQKAKDIFETS